MNRDVLCKRRQCNPIESLPARAKDWVLCFGLAAVPFLEPGMGTIVQRKQFKGNSFIENAPDVVGVAHKLTLVDFSKILLTEGSPSTEHPDTDVAELENPNSSAGGYHLIPISIQPLSDSGEPLGKPIMALTLTTTSPKRLKPEALCSKRYLNLLITGAKLHSLPTAYVSWLESLDYFKPNWTKRIAGFFFIGVLLVIGAPVMIFARVAEMIYPEKPEALLRRMGKRATSGAWNFAVTLESMIAPIFGSGWNNK